MRFETSETFRPWDRDVLLIKGICDFIIYPWTAGGLYPPPFFLNNFGSRRNLEVRFYLFLGAHYGGSPIEKFPVVTLWRPLQQMSVETILYKFVNEKGIIISTNVKDQR